MLSDITPESVEAALAEFDRLGRETFVARHPQAKTGSRFVVRAGNRYDLGPVVDAAHVASTGAPLSDEADSVVEEALADYLRSLGYEVAQPARQLAWTADELILALDLYLRLPKARRREAAPEVQELSEVLRSLTVFAPAERGPSFRNPKAVSLKLHNFAALDPAEPGKGMTHGARLDQEVWDLWAHRPDELREAAESIRRHGAGAAALPPTDEDEEHEAVEGRILYRLHRARERDRGLAKKKRNAVRKKTGRLVCEVCGLDPQQLYGDFAADLVDVHHVLPLSHAGERVTRLDDLAVVCPTCHRALHAHRPVVTPAELGLILRHGSPTHADLRESTERPGHPGLATPHAESSEGGTNRLV